MRLHDGFRRPFRKRGGRRRIAQGPQFAAAARLRALHRAAVGELVHLAAPRKSPLHGCTGCVPPLTIGRSSAYQGATLLRRATFWGAACAQPAALGSAAASRGRGLRRRYRDHAASSRGRRISRAAAVHVYRATKSMEGRVFVDADGELSSFRSRARSSFRPNLVVLKSLPEASASSRGERSSASQLRSAKRAATSRRITGSRFGCPSSDRSVPTASPTHATSKLQSPGSRIRTNRPRSSRNRSVTCGP